MRERILFVVILLLLRGCASITTPNGGPKDLKKPELVSSTPKNNQTNFKGKTVQLNFNELVKLNNPREEIIISPTPGRHVEIKVKGTTVTITPEIPWRDSTTYSIVPREGIQDVTESNSADSLKLAFSTGPDIDSLRITGRIFDLLKGVPAQKVTVGIFQPDTFDIFTDTSSYFTKTDKKGRYRIDNIKAGKYRIYAFDDKNKNLKVESRAERYGFLSRELNLQQHIDSINFGLIMLDSRPLKISSIRNLGTTTRLKFNKFTTRYTITADSDITHAYADSQAEITFWNPRTTDDSLQLHLFASDSLDNTLDSTFYLKKTNAKSPKENFKWSLGSPKVDSETGKLLTVMSLTKPIININFDSLYLELDTLCYDTFNKQEVSIDLVNKQMTFTKMLDKKLFKAAKDPVFKLKAGEGFIFSIDSDTSKRASAPVSILWPEDTGILSVETQTRERNYVIQLLKDGKVFTTIHNQAKYTFKNLAPGDYQIRTIIDSNNNGKWDPGNVYKNIEPERVIYYKTQERKPNFPIRPNWELGPLILRF